MVISSMPILASRDIQASLKFYQEVLGFDFAWAYGEPPDAAAVSFGDVSIMFLLQPDLADKIAGHQHWIKVDDADAMYALHLERGAKILSPPEDKPWGGREYTVEDPSGYHLRFAGPPSSEVKPSVAFPEGVIIVRRLPAVHEYEAVAGKAFNQERVAGDILERTWDGVVALSPAGEPIGVLRIMQDAPGWFSIWDVAVLPEWQGQRIGQRLMEEALEAVRTESPGAWVFLFTYQHGFYEKLGFGKETVSMRKV